MDLLIDCLNMGKTINPPETGTVIRLTNMMKSNPLLKLLMRKLIILFIKPEQGFGFIRMYESLKRENRLNDTFVIQNGDTMVLPRGNHPLTFAPEYQIFYLFALAGEKRKYGAWSGDPARQWVRACEPIFKGK